MGKCGDDLSQLSTPAVASARLGTEIPNCGWFVGIDTNLFAGTACNHCTKYGILGWMAGLVDEASAAETRRIEDVFAWIGCLTRPHTASSVSKP